MSGQAAAPSPRVIAFDGDDTLWRNEDRFAFSQARFRALIGAHVPLEGSNLDARLLETERRNLALYGYGVKSFVLSMIETAIELTEGAIPAGDIRDLLRLGQDMLVHPVELLEGARETLEVLRAQGHDLWLITKGDLFDQESKLARSGLEPLFDRIEIVSEKDARMYRRLLARHGVDPAEFAMVGNTLRSDVLPVLAIGGRAFHVPYHLTWAHEHAEPDPDAGYVTLQSLGELLKALSPAERGRGRGPLA